MTAALQQPCTAVAPQLAHLNLSPAVAARRRQQDAERPSGVLGALEMAHFYAYRTYTVLTSMASVYALPQDTIDRFMEAFMVFDYDWADEPQMIKAYGPDYMNVVRTKVQDWYKVLHHLCALGEVEKMYVPPAIEPKAGLIKNQILFERLMADALQIEPGQKVLEIGCGRGRISHQVATYTGAHVTGINIDLTQLSNAKSFAKARGKDKQLHFEFGDLNEPLAFADESFDATYHVQVFSYARDLLAVFKEVYRVLKPGGRFSCLDWVTLEAYDHNNKEHRMLVQSIKGLLGAIGTPTQKQYVDLLREAGFEIEVDTEPSVNGLQSPLIDRVNSEYVELILRSISNLVSWGLLPPFFETIVRRQMQNADTFIKLVEMRLCTTSWWIVARKPLNA